MTGYPDWTVTFFDAASGTILEESYVGLDAAAVSRRIAHKLDNDPRLANVAAWDVSAVAVDFVDK